jgi:hypothetical protein
MVSQLAWGIVLEFAGRYHEKAKSTIKSWKSMKFESKAEKFLMSKFTRSCRPLIFGHQGGFTITRLSLLKFIIAIVKGTVRAVLAVRKML